MVAKHISPVLSIFQISSQDDRVGLQILDDHGSLQRHRKRTRADPQGLRAKAQGNLHRWRDGPLWMVAKSCGDGWSPMIHDGISHLSTGVFHPQYLKGCGNSWETGRKVRDPRGHGSPLGYFALSRSRSSGDNRYMCEMMPNVLVFLYIVACFAFQLQNAYLIQA